MNEYSLAKVQYIINVHAIANAHHILSRQLQLHTVCLITRRRKMCGETASWFSSPHNRCLKRRRHHGCTGNVFPLLTKEKKYDNYEKVGLNITAL